MESKFARQMLEKMDLDVQFENKKRELEEVREQKEKLLELQDKTSLNLKANANLESQLAEKSKQLELSNRKRDNLERELITARSEVAGIKRILELEREERRELETRALNLIKGAKRKWENTEKYKVAHLNKHIETQTVRIAELCRSNNEMSVRLQRAESELKTATTELNKLRAYRVQYKESLEKMKELSRQSAQGLGNKLEQMAAQAHNQLAELRTKLELKAAKIADLENKLENEQNSNHCHQSRLNVALELAQSELQDCQEQLRSFKAIIPAQNTEIEELKKELFQKNKQLETAVMNKQTFLSMQEQIEKLAAENEHLKNQLKNTKSNLSDTLMSLEQREAIALNLERVEEDKATLELRLRTSLEKEEEQLRKVGNLEELLRRLEHSVTKLEAENASLKAIEHDKPNTSTSSSSGFYDQKSKNISQLEQQVQKLEQELQVACQSLAAEQKVGKQAQISLWKKEKELSDVNLDKRIATREAKTAEEKIKTLQVDKQKLAERLRKKEKDEEEKAAKLLKEMDNAKASLADLTRESSRNKMQADSAQRALTQANKQIEELQSSSSSLRRELDATRTQMRGNQDRIDSLKTENERLKVQISKHNDVITELETKLDKLQQEVNSYQVNNELLKETCTVLEEQLTDYDRLTNDHETRENTLIQDKVKLQKDLDIAEIQLRECKIDHNKEKTMRIDAERAIERLESETSDIESERNDLVAQRDEYKKLAYMRKEQIDELSTKCDNLECDLSQVKRFLDVAKDEARYVKEESSQHLTRLLELKENNLDLKSNLRENEDQRKEHRARVAELEGILDEMRQFYQAREVKSGSTCQQQTKLIDYLQLKLEQYSKKKKGVCDKIFGLKQKENCPVGMAMPVGYRELENQLEKEREKVKALTEQMLAVKTTNACSTLPTSPQTSPEQKHRSHYKGDSEDLMTRHLSLQRMKHNIPHRFNVNLSMRAGKCAACLDSIQFGKRAAICSECQIMSHLKCSVSFPATCGLPGNFAKKFGGYKESSDSVLSLVDSVKTLAIDEPDKPERDTDHFQRNGDVSMQSWVKVPGRTKSSWERKYLILEGTSLNIYEDQPSPGMVPISHLDLPEKEGFMISESVDHADVAGTAKSDLPFIIRVEPNSSTTCWPTSRLDIMILSQLDKKNWLKALRSLTNKPGRIDKYQTVLRVEKNQLDFNCIVELPEEGVLLLGAEEGLYSFQFSNTQVLTLIKGVKKVHQLTIHPKLGLALMIAGEDRQLVSCDLRQLKSNALATECSLPAISTKPVLTASESCHLYQVQEETLCAATTSHIILLKWKTTEQSGEFIGVRELETTEPTSCALFTENTLIVGCNKFFQIDITNYSIDDFPEEDDNSLKAALLGVARLGIFPVCVLDVSNNSQNVELLLCYNEFGIFVNENGQRTRNINPNWSHLPFAFAYRKPYLFIIHFSSVEIIKLDSDSFQSCTKKQDRTLIELNNPRYLGLAGSRGIYVSAVNSFFELLKIEGISLTSGLSDSLIGIDSLSQNEDNTSEFSFTSSLIEVLDGQGGKVQFENGSNHQN